MLKQALILLSDADAAPQVLGERWSWRPTLVVGRQHAVHLTIDASGVPWRQTGEYARLQVPRLAPFADVDGVFVRQGALLHVWVWPAELVQQALARMRWDAKRPVRVWPESLWGVVPRHGAVLQACAQGVEVLRFADGHLRQTQWWPQEPGAEALAGVTANATLTRSRLSARDRLRQSRPWTWQVHALGLERSSGAGARRWSGASAWVIAGWLALAASLGYGTWVLREGWLLAKARADVQGQLDAWVRSRQEHQGARAAPATVQDAQWAQSVREATRGVQLDRLLRQLAAPLAERGLQVHELVVERDGVKIALVSGFGGAVDLDLAVSALEQSGPWERLELLDTANTAQPRFGFKLPKDWL